MTRKENPVMVAEWLEQCRADLRTIGRAYPRRLSEARLDALDSCYSAWLARLSQLDPRTLTVSQRVDRWLGIWAMERGRRHLARDRERGSRVEAWAPWLRSLSDILDRHAAHEVPHAERVARDLEAVARDIDQAQIRLAHTDPAALFQPPRARETADAVVGECKAMAQALRDWYAFYDGYDPIMTWWVRRPVEAVAQSLEAYADALRQALVGEAGFDAVGEPIGPDAVAAELQAALIPHDAGTLMELARSELEWCHEEMNRAARELGVAGWRDAVELVKGHHCRPGEQPGAIYGLAAEALRFVDEHDLVTVPELARATWRAKMMTPELQRVNPFFTGGETLSISFPHESMTIAHRLMSMRGNNLPFSRATVFHELIPGHYLQQFMGDRHRPYRRLFHNPYWTEGNALYWEFVFWCEGFARTAEDRVGMLFWRSHRAARVLYTLGFHSGTMSPRDAVALLENEVGHERANAEAEVRRMTVPDYDPLYQAAYLVGGWQFWALRREVVGHTLGAKAYHDAILHENQMPVAALRAILRPETCTDDGPAPWPFADHIRPGLLD
jgi:hypothetical protein